MLRGLPVILTLVALLGSALAVEQRHGVLVGTVLRLDAASKTVVVKLADGTEHTLRFAAGTAVHGARGTAAGAKDTFRGLQTGSEVAVHYTAKGTEETADEVDNIGTGGLKATEGTVTRVDSGARTVTVKTAGGAEETYRLTDSAAKEVGKGAADGAEKSAKVTVYYSEEAGHKVAHFLKRAL